MLPSPGRAGASSTTRPASASRPRSPPASSSTSPDRPAGSPRRRASAARAVEALLRAGVGGPYGLALGPEAYTRVLETSEHGGYPLFDHLRKIIGGPLVWSPGVQGAVVVSQRGGDFLLDAGEDLSVGYE